MRIVRCAPKPSLRAASCCSVEVVNGGDGIALALLLLDVRDRQRAAGRGLLERARRTSSACVAVVIVNCSTFCAVELASAAR